MNQTQSYQSATFFQLSKESESLTMSQSPSFLKTIVFETWEQFEKWFNELKINHSSFLENSSSPSVQQLQTYSHLQEKECQLKVLSDYLKCEETLSLDSLREIWMVSQPILTEIWNYPHQWVQSVSHEVQIFLNVWQMKNQLTDQRFQELGELPTCCLTEMDWEAFCQHQESLCQMIEPYLMCLNEDVVARYERAIRWIRNIETLDEVNQQVIEGEWEVNRDFFSDYEGKSLNSVQSQAILSDGEATLVMGGAGTGKTTTLLAKIKYLIQRKQVPLNEILVLGASQEQLNGLKRDLGELSSHLQFKTYHKLALELLTKELGYVPTLADEGLLNHCIQQTLSKWFSDPECSATLTYFFAKDLGVSLSQYRVSTLKEFYELSDFKELQQLEISSWQDIEHLANTLGQRHLTLKHEWVKSHEEVLLANFLFLNGIDYQYESPYPYSTSDEHYRQYYPDFYLPQYDLYLEHFGLNEQHKACWLNPSEAQKYEESVNWKRQLHHTHHTRLIETYSYEFQSSDWMASIRRKLENQGVHFQRVELYDVLKHLANSQRPLYHRFSTHLKRYIELFYKQGKTLVDLKGWIQAETHKQDQTSTHVFYQLVDEICTVYESRLKALKMMDLNQLFLTVMRNTPLTCSTFRYLLTDHIEDCTNQQFEFLIRLVQQNQMKWFMTADEGQTIRCLQDTHAMTFKKNYQTLMQQLRKTQLFNLEINYRLTPNEEAFFGHLMLNHLAVYPKKEFAMNYQKTIYTYEYRFDWLTGLESSLHQLASTQASQERIAMVGASLPSLLASGKFKVYKQFKKGIQLKYSDFPTLQLFYFYPKQLKGHEVDHLIVLDTDWLEKNDQLSELPQAFNSLLPYTPQPFVEEQHHLYYSILTRATKSLHLVISSHSTNQLLCRFAQSQVVQREWFEKDKLSFLNFIPQFDQRLIEFPISNPSSSFYQRQIS